MRNLLCALALLAPSLSLAAPELQGNPEELRTFLHPAEKSMTIHGEAEEKAYTDRAIVSLAITTEAKQLSEALSANTAVRTSIIKQLIAAGVPGSDIKSSNFSSSPQFGWFGGKPSSYKVINRMAITVHDEPQFQAVAATADATAEAEIVDTSFEHSRENEFEEKARKQAMAEVLRKKAYFEQSLGLSLVATGVRENRSEQQASAGAVALEEIVVTASLKSDGASRASSFDENEPEPTFDEVIYHSSIQVDFKIIEGKAQ